MSYDDIEELEATVATLTAERDALARDKAELRREAADDEREIRELNQKVLDGIAEVTRLREALAAITYDYPKGWAGTACPECKHPLVECDKRVEPPTGWHCAAGIARRALTPPTPPVAAPPTPGTPPCKNYAACGNLALWDGVLCAGCAPAPLAGRVARHLEDEPESPPLRVSTGVEDAAYICPICERIGDCTPSRCSWAATGGGR